MAVAALDKTFSKSWYVELIANINLALAMGTIASTSGTVTTALSDLAAERDKH